MRNNTEPPAVAGKNFNPYTPTKPTPVDSVLKQVLKTEDRAAKTAGSVGLCSFCAVDAAGVPHTFDLGALPRTTFVLGPNGSRPGNALAPVQYSVTAPCGTALPSGAHAGGPVCLGLGRIVALC